jgi:hypothetical protein
MTRNGGWCLDVKDGKPAYTDNFSADETVDFGADKATPVVAGIGKGRAARFTGKIDGVVVEVK